MQFNDEEKPEVNLYEKANVVYVESHICLFTIRLVGKLNSLSWIQHYTKA